MELELECGDVKVVGMSSRQEEDYKGNDRKDQTPLSVGSQVIHIVKPAQQWCSCGVWQEFLYPCRHGCAVYQKWEEKARTKIRDRKCGSATCSTGTTMRRSCSIRMCSQYASTMQLMIGGNEAASSDWATGWAPANKKNSQTK